MLLSQARLRSTIIRCVKDRFVEIRPPDTARISPARISIEDYLFGRGRQVVFCRYVLQRYCFAKTCVPRKALLLYLRWCLLPCRNLSCHDAFPLAIATIALERRSFHSWKQHRLQGRQGNSNGPIGKTWAWATRSPIPKPAIS
jgi:hypothetical protein